MKIVIDILISLVLGVLMVAVASVGIVGGSLVICAASLAGFLLAGG